MDNVQMFATDKNMRNDVKDYIINFMALEIVRKAFNNESVAGYHEAKSIIESSFANMEKEFGTEYPKETVNEME